MNTIDTIEDLIDVLDRNPRWMDALRSRILTREVLELPARFAELVERLDSFREEVSGLNAGTNRRFDNLDAKTDDLATRTGRLETKTDRMLDDLGYLKGTHARNAAVERAPTIARALGLSYTKTLTDIDLWDITDGADTTAIDRGSLDSFRNADLILEAVDASGEACYVAVEISFTANGRDTRRALRNADFLTRFTGRNAHAVVSGMKQDDRIREVIESGAVFWYQLDPEMMEAE